MTGSREKKAVQTQFREHIYSAHTSDITATQSLSALEASEPATPSLLNILGIEQQTARYIGPLEIATVGWSICISYVAIASTLSLVVGEGGSVTLLYGEIVVFVAYGCIVATLAELASVYPTAGGQ